MKKTNLIHLIITVTGIFLCYSALNLFPNLFVYLIFWFADGLAGGRMLEGLISSFLFFGTYLIMGILVLKNSKKLTNYIVAQYDVYSPPILNPSRHDLLYILFIGLGIYNLMQKLPLLLQDLYEVISHENRGDLLDNISGKNINLVPGIISVIISIIILVYAKYFADQFSDKIPSETDTDETIESTS